MNAPEQDELKIGDRIAERYEILAILGQGHYGSVYKCRHSVIDRIVAIKTLRLSKKHDDASRRRFEREARLASKMDHQNLISVSDFGYTLAGDPYLVMEFVDGQQLLEILHREQHLAPERAINIFIQICDGLYHAHQRDIIHRDLKPANILVTQNGGLESVKIVDLGIAKIALGNEDEVITKTGEVCGSPVYLSPEQCLSLDLDQRTDIYSLGVCLYQSLTGTAPLKAATVYETLKMHVYETPRPFSVVAPQLAIPKQLEEIVFRCLAKEPRKRYENMIQIKHELMRLRNSEFEKSSVHVLPPDSFFQAQHQTPSSRPGIKEQPPILMDEQPDSTQEIANEDGRYYQSTRQTAGRSQPDWAGERNAALLSEIKQKPNTDSIDTEPGANISSKFVRERASSQDKNSTWLVVAGVAISLSIAFGIASLLNRKQAGTPIPASPPGQTTTQTGSNKSSATDSSLRQPAQGNKNQSQVSNSKHNKSQHNSAFSAHTHTSHGHNLSHSTNNGGVRIVRHSDGRVDVYDTDEEITPNYPTSNQRSSYESSSSNGDVSIRRHADGTVDVIDTSPTTRRH